MHTNRTGKVLTFIAMLLATRASLAQDITMSGCESVCDSMPATNEWTSSNLLLAGEPAAASPLSGSAEIGTIFLGRSGLNGQAIAADGDGNVLLSASDLDADLAGGVFFKFAFLNIAPTRAWDLEFEMFGVDNIASKNIVNADEVVTTFFNSIPVAPVDSETVSYISDIQNYELNWRFRCRPRLRLLAGMRYLLLEEHFDVFNTGSNLTVPGVNRIGSFSHTQNQMIGGQIGAASTFWQNDFWSVYGSAKYAFLHNTAEGRATARNGSGEDIDASFFDNSTPRLWDFELGAFTTISEHVGLKAGYRGLIAEDVALAPNQSNSVDLFDGPSNMTFSNAEWHGFFVSLEAVW